MKARVEFLGSSSLEGLAVSINAIAVEYEEKGFSIDTVQLITEPNAHYPRALVLFKKE